KKVFYLKEMIRLIKYPAAILLFTITFPSYAEEAVSTDVYGLLLIMLTATFLLAGAVIWVVWKMLTVLRKQRLPEESITVNAYLKDFDATELNLLTEARNVRHKRSGLLTKAGLVLFGLLLPASLFAQNTTPTTTLWSQPGIVITVVLIFIPLAIGVVF